MVLNTLVRSKEASCKFTPHIIGFKRKFSLAWCTSSISHDHVAYPIFSRKEESRLCQKCLFVGELYIYKEVLKVLKILDEIHCFRACIFIQPYKLSSGNILTNI